MMRSGVTKFVAVSATLCLMLSCTSGDHPSTGNDDGVGGSHAGDARPEGGAGGNPKDDGGRPDLTPKDAADPSSACSQGQTRCSDNVCRTECPDVTWLGEVEGCASAVSANGGTVVGYGLVSGKPVAFVWTKERGSQRLGLLPGRTETAPTAISPGGDIVVGMAVEKSVIWNPAIAEIPWPVPYVNAAAVSDLGQVVGHDRNKAYSWKAATGSLELPLSEVVGISANGKVIGGAVRGLGGSHSLAVVVDGSIKRVSSAIDSFPSRLSGDGKVVVGFVRPKETAVPILWRHAEPSYVEVGSAPANLGVGLRAVNLDGTIVLGAAFSSGAESVSMYWSAATGMVTLSSVLPPFAASISSSFDAYDISWDGKVIVGCANNPQGKREAVRLVLP